MALIWNLRGHLLKVRSYSNGKKLMGEQEIVFIRFFGENFSKIIYKGYFHAIFEKKF